MALNPEVAPVFVEFKARRGRTFQAKITVYEDAAMTKRQNLSGLNVVFIVEGYLSLSSGSGLTINAAEGEITVRLTPAQTREAPQDRHTIVLTVEENPEVIVEPVCGEMSFARAPGA